MSSPKLKTAEIIIELDKYVETWYNIYTEE